MPAERAGFTVTMFLIDVSASMGTERSVEMVTTSGETRTVEMTNLQWALQLVKLRIQEMIFNGRKTDQCGVIIFGSEHTNNIVNKINGGYENVAEYIPISTPSGATLAKLDALQASSVHGDPIDALIVGVETQQKYLEKKRTWTRKVVIVTDGESPIEVEDWELTTQRMDALSIHLAIVGVDFDDADMDYEADKSNIKRENEEFFRTLASSMSLGSVHSLAYAMLEATYPEVKTTRSALMGTVLRIGDISARSDEAAEISVKATKCTALARPKAFKKFALQAKPDDDDEAMDVDFDPDHSSYAQLGSRTEYYVDKRPETEVNQEEEDDDEDLLGPGDGDREEGQVKPKNFQLERVEKEDLVRGFKYGTTYVPCPDGQFPGLQTNKGIDICGFFPAANFRRELSMGEIQYIWGDPLSPQHQVAVSSIVKGMQTKKAMAIARWVSRDGADPKMGVLMPKSFDNVDCLAWAQVPFADDIRKYSFPSLTNLVSKKGEQITEHPYLPTDAQQEAIDDFVDAMDLMDAGPKHEDGTREPWFNPVYSFNPAIHRIKQAIFHCAVVPDVNTHPLPPPHPELTKYFEPSKRAVKRAQAALGICQAAFNVKEIPKKVGRTRKDDHQHARDADDDILILDREPIAPSASQAQTSTHFAGDIKGKAPSKAAPEKDGDGSETEPDTDEEGTQATKPKAAFVRSSTPIKPKVPAPGLPTPARSPVSTLDIDPTAGRPPGRIVGSVNPLKDFQANLRQGDVVSKAVEDLCFILLDLIDKPFVMRRKDELLQCMAELRKTCLEDDEIDQWNMFLRDLKKACVDNHRSSPFWEAVQDFGREISLISVQEAKKLGGESKVSENEATEVSSNHR